MAEYTRDRAFVLKTEPFREHDAWATLYTRSQGKWVAVVRGVRRAHAKHVGHIECATEIEVMIAKGIAFDKVAVAKQVRPFFGLRKTLSGQVLAGVVLDAVDRLTHQGSADEQVYDLLDETFSLLECLPSELTSLRAQLVFSTIQLKLLGVLGYAPDVDRCASCHEAFSEAVALDQSRGTLLCHKCTHRNQTGSFADMILPERFPSLLRFLRERPLIQSLSLTAPSEVFTAVNHAVDLFTGHTPLQKALHGQQTLLSFLTQRT